LITTFVAAMDLLLSICVLVLTVGIFFPALRIFRRWKKSEEEEKHELEKTFYLTYSAVIIILGIRLFMVPLYFWTLQGFVPMIPGAMCLWGVFDAYPGVTWGALPLKFVLPVLYIGWLLLSYLNGKSKTHPLMQNMMAFFIIVAPLVLIDAGTDILTFSQISPVKVNCCTSAIDVGTRPVPGSIAGVSGQVFLLLAFFVVAAAFAVTLILALKHRVAHWIALALTIPLSGVLVLTMTEVFAPWLLDLPYHHCPFCLLSDHPLSIVFLTLLWFGLAAPWLVLITGKLGRENAESKEAEARLKQKLLTYATISVMISLALIALDLLLTFI
jgi:hypothetical protein